MDKLEAALKYLRAIARRYGLALNPDEAVVNRLAGYMAENKRRYGKYFCPCKQGFPLDPASDPVCPCGEFRDEIARDGHCECHVFFDAAATAQAKRRPGLLATVTCPG